MANSRCTNGTSNIHDVGQIQGCGYLLVLEEVQDDIRCSSGLRIVGASANIVNASWVTASTTAELHGKDLTILFPEKGVETVRSLIKRHKETRKPSPNHLVPEANRNVADLVPFFPRIRGELALPRQEVFADDSSSSKSEALSCTLSGCNPGFFLVEIEKKRGPYSARKQPTPGLLEVANILGRVPLGCNPQVSTGALADTLLAQFSAYDRIMVYRFASDGSGHVINESIRPGVEVPSSYLDLRFPAEDIPLIARDCLKQAGVRFIADTSMLGVPVDLFQERIAKVDLSLSALRAPLDCHLAYLRNMGVKSSLVVRILVNSELWGLYSCHSYKQVVIPTCEERIMVEMAATVTSSMILHYQREEIARTGFALSRTMRKFSNHTRVQSFLSAEHKTLLDILNVDTIVFGQELKPAFVYGNQYLSLTPEERKYLLRETDSQHKVVFTALAGRSVAFFSVRCFVVAFVRAIIPREVKWAGKPGPTLRDQGWNLPRASFERCFDHSAEASEPWSPATIDLIAMVRHGISSHIYAEALPADLQETFSQMSHDLRTPFHGVMGSLEMLQAGHTDMDVEERKEIIDSAFLCGNSMMSTLNDILDIAKDRNNTEVAHKRFVASRPIFKTMKTMAAMATKNMVKLTAAISAGTAETSERTTGTTIAQFGAGPSSHVVVGDERRLNQVVQNLVNNSIKFTPSGGTVEISVLSFDSLDDTTNWWQKKVDRFDGSVWKMNANDTHFAEDEAGLSPKSGAAGAGAGAGVPSSETTQRRWYVYCIEDTGVGVAKGDLSSLMEAYRRVSKGTRKTFQGTGLGLHMCKINVNIMRGGFGVASTCASEDCKGASGTLFAVVVPLLRVVQEIETSKPPAVGEGELANTFRAEVAKVVTAIWGDSSSPRCGDGSAGRDNSTGLGKELVFLVVDDNNVNVKLTMKKIRMVFSGCPGKIRVLSATSGRAAVELLQAVRHGELTTKIDGKGAPLVVAGMFMDVHMPDMDGVECTKMIRKLETKKGWPRVPICGLTADVTETMRKRFLEAGGFDVVHKPWGKGQVEATCMVMLTKVIEGARRKEGSDVAVDRCG